MKTITVQRLSKQESECINFSEVTIRLLSQREEIEIFDTTISHHHYLRNCNLVGEQLRYVAEHKGRWIALSSWSSAARHLKDRDKWIGWNQIQCKNRLCLVANNSRYLLLTQAGYCPNLGSFVMGKILKRLSDDWQQKYAHPILCVESFVDPDYFKGTLYKACGWELLGQTKGHKRVRMDFYEKHDKPKQLWVRELKASSKAVLMSCKLPEAMNTFEAKGTHYCNHSQEALGHLHDFVASLPDWRHHRRNYHSGALVALLITAALCGVSSGQRDLAAFANCLEEQQLQALGFVQLNKQGKLRRPSESTFQRALSGINPDILQQTLLDYQEHFLGKQQGDGGVVGFDGKALRGGKCKLQTLNFFDTRQAGRWIGSKVVETKTNEIPVSQKTLTEGSLKLEARLVMADALNTQKQTAQNIVQDCGADYLFVVKDNQPQLKAFIEKEFSASEISEFPPQHR